jgi:hypothetical protein
MALDLNAKRRFTIAEVFFFERWYEMQTQAMKQTVKELVKVGRLEFVGGGWVGEDLTCPTYEELIMNMVAGHSFLRRKFGIAPKHAWQVDSIGYSSALPELMNKMGFESVSIARVSEAENEKRKKERALEFQWESDFEDEQKPSSIFTHVMQNNYNGPCGLDMTSQQFTLERDADAHFGEMFQKLK